MTTAPMNFRPTRHCEARMRQRGIRSEAMEVILQFGRCRRSRGADTYVMDRSTRQHARDALGRNAYARIERQLGAYVIADTDGTLITVAHAKRRYWG